MLDDELTGAPAAESDAQEAAPPAKKAPAKKAAARKSTAKKAPAKKAAAKKADAQDAAAEPAAVEGDAAPAAPVVVTTTRRRTTKKAAAAPASEATAGDAAEPAASVGGEAADEPAAAKAPARKRAPRKKAASPAPVAAAEGDEPLPLEAEAASGVGAVLFQAPEATKTPARRTRKTAAQKRAEAEQAEAEKAGTEQSADEQAPESAEADTAEKAPARKAAAKKKAAKKTTKKSAEADEADAVDEESVAAPDAEADEEGAPAEDASTEDGAESDQNDEDETDEDGQAAEGAPARRRRRRGGRRRRKSGDSAGGDASNGAEEGAETEAAASEGETSDETDAEDGGESGSGSSRRRRRRRRAGEEGNDSGEDDANTVTKVRKARSAEDQITAVSGSTRLEAKKQRRREGREAGRRRAPIVSEAEFLARRESVDRVMAIRQRADLTQIAVLEDKVLVEHYVARESQTSLIGNVYLGRVQNVLPSMEAAFIDIGKGRNAVLYAGEVNWQALGHKEGQPRKIESVLSSGQTVLVQVTKDPVGQKGARLTSQVSLAGRFLVYVPDGTTSGISRKLPDTERNRLKTLLKEIVPDGAGVIVRTAAEGASEDELTRDVERLRARWEDIERKARGSAPQLLYGEPDLTLKVVRDLFTEDFSKLVIDGDEAWETVHGYVEHVAPDLAERMERFEPATEGKAAGKDVFGAYRITEQIQKGLDRKVWLPSGGSLIIDRTEAMTVVDVNTGKFTGTGGNLEETVTKNNLEAAEEIVRQLRLRDIGGIIVVDFIDMVLESNRDLVVRRLVECLGRDRTRHQVAEVTSLGLVQMTRKRIGTGLLESFSHNCEHCHGRGVVIQDQPVDPAKNEDDSRRGSRRNRGRGRGNGEGDQQKSDSGSKDTIEQAVAASAPAKAMPPGAPHGEPSTPRAEATDAAADADDIEMHAAGGAAAKDIPVVREEPVAAVEVAAAPAEAADVVAEDATEVVPASEAPSEAPSEADALTPGPAAASEAAEPAQEPAPVAAAPKVVTRTRRRSASRPAGPPVAEADGQSNGQAVGQAVDAAQTGETSVGAAEVSEAADEPHVEHVPIKKKGARKR